MIKLYLTILPQNSYLTQATLVLVLPHLQKSNALFMSLTRLKQEETEFAMCVTLPHYYTLNDVIYLLYLFMTVYKVDGWHMLVFMSLQKCPVDRFQWAKFIGLASVGVGPHTAMCQPIATSIIPMAFCALDCDSPRHFQLL